MVFDPEGLIGGGAEHSLAVGFIVGIIPGEPDGLAIPLK
jgi:hypothetical protein